MPQINTKVSDETYRQIRWLREHRSYSLRDVMTIAVDRIYREQEDNMTRITAAQCIRPYLAPQYLITPIGPPCDANALQILNAHAWTTIKGVYSACPHIIASSSTGTLTTWPASKKSPTRILRSAPPSRKLSANANTG